MRHNRLLRAAALLGVFTLLSVALLAGVTQAKFASMGTGTATGNIAKWSVTPAWPSGNVMFDGATWVSAGGTSDSVQRDFTITNDSDVAIDVYLQLKLLDSDFVKPITANTVYGPTGALPDAVASITAVSNAAGSGYGPFRVNAKTVGTIRLTIQAPGGGITAADQTKAYRQYIVDAAYATQVD